MSLFSWLSRKKTPPRSGATSSSPQHSAHAALSATNARNGRAQVEPQLLPAADPTTLRRNERMERREMLYIVVRDAMVRAGVLSAGYKFKVLSLDQRGRQFLAMIDLAREYGGETVRLSEIEALIAQTARTRYDIQVTAVYWRINDQVPSNVPAPASAPAPATAPAPAASAATVAPVVSASAPAVVVSVAPVVVAPPVVRPAPIVPPRQAPAAPAPSTAASGAAPGALPAVALASAGAVATAAPAATGGRFEPIEADEVEAFKRALLDAASSRSAPPPASAVVLPSETVRTGPLRTPTSGRTGFEDTEMPAPDSRLPDLSNTQYGQL